MIYKIRDEDFEAQFVIRDARVAYKEIRNNDGTITQSLTITKITNEKQLQESRIERIRDLAKHIP